jgi:hypothetical protein
MTIRTTLLAFASALMLAAPAKAELLRVEIKTLGMD